MNVRIIVVAMWMLMLSGMAMAATAPAPVPRTGQTICYYRGTPPLLGCADPLVVGQDGALKKGVTVPEGTSRFTDNENGTVTDNLTGLIWLKNATCFGAVNWDTALALSNTLEASAMACGLTDGSKAGDWRLPNIRELSSLVDASAYSPALTAAYPFLNVLTDKSYQSSTTDSFADAYRLSIIMTTGAMNKSVAGALNYFWPVRGPQ